MEGRRERLEEVAARWLERRESGTWTESEQARLAQWLEDSVSNRVTFLRLEAAWEETGRLKALKPGFRPRTVPTADQLQLNPILHSEAGLRADSGLPRLRKSSRMRAAAAAAVAVLGVACYTYASLSGDRFSTPVGGLASVPLKDGSSITLNTESKVWVDLNSKARHIELAKGEAFFDVAADPSRPFTVTAGTHTITAIGTAFSVRRSAGDVQVIVTSGKVRIAGEGREEALSAGGIAHADPNGITVQRRTSPQLEESLSWRTGYLVFHESALPEAISEFNRYNQRKLVLQCASADGRQEEARLRDPCAIRVTGKFRSTNNDGLVRLLERSFHLTARASGDTILLSRQ